MRTLMRSSTLALATVLGLLVGPDARAITLNFANNTGGEIVFNGTGGAANFSLTPGSGGNEFTITSVNGGTGSAMGLQGNINSNGPGPLSFSGYSSPGGGVQTTSPITPNGTLTILDGATPLTGTVNWVSISTLGSGGLLNTNAELNLTGVAYAGANADLVSLKNQASVDGVVTLSFQFTVPTPLSAIEASGATNSTSYSGSISAVVPEPTSIAMALAGLPVLGLLWARRRERA